VTEHAPNTAAAVMAAERSAEVILATAERAEAAAHCEECGVAVVVVVIVVMRVVALAKPAVEVHKEFSDLS
jgi:hypothetical protein